MENKKSFEVGDKAFCLARGNGFVVTAKNSGAFPVVVKFECGEFESFTIDGRRFPADKHPSLHHGHDLVVSVIEPEYEYQILIRNVNTNWYNLTDEHYKSINDLTKVVSTDYLEYSLLENSKRLVKK